MKWNRQGYPPQQGGAVVDFGSSQRSAIPGGRGYCRAVRFSSSGSAGASPSQVNNHPRLHPAIGDMRFTPCCQSQPPLSNSVDKVLLRIGLEFLQQWAGCKDSSRRSETATYFHSPASRLSFSRRRGQSVSRSLPPTFLLRSKSESKPDSSWLADAPCRF